MSTGIKECQECHEVKARDLFPESSSAEGRYHTCKACLTGVVDEYKDYEDPKPVDNRQERRLVQKQVELADPELQQLAEEKRKLKAEIQIVKRRANSQKWSIQHREQKKVKLRAEIEALRAKKAELEQTLAK